MFLQVFFFIKPYLWSLSLLINNKDRQCKSFLDNANHVMRCNTKRTIKWSPKEHPFIAFVAWQSGNLVHHPPSGMTSDILHDLWHLAWPPSGHTFVWHLQNPTPTLTSLYECMLCPVLASTYMYINTHTGNRPTVQTSTILLRVNIIFTSFITLLKLYLNIAIITWKFAECVFSDKLWNMVHVYWHHMSFLSCQWPPLEMRVSLGRMWCHIEWAYMSCKYLPE